MVVLPPPEPSSLRTFHPLTRVSRASASAGVTNPGGDVTTRLAEASF
jgi:hypothetical protein